MRLYFLALVPAAAALHVRLAPVRPRLGTPRCTLADGDVPFDRAPELPSAADLVAQNDGRRVAVSGLQPQAQQGQESQEYVGVPPPAAEPPRAPGMMSNARGPLIGFTLIATAGVSAWQSKRMLVRRQAALLEEFAGTMVFHLGDEREMATALRSFRSQLGPGRYTGRMFTAFLKAMATTKSIGVDSVLQLKSATALFGLTDSACAQYLESAASDLKQQPSVLGKLCFLAERAMPMPASLAKLRTKFPNWSFDTVTALQRAMLENLYRELCEDLPRDATPDAQTLEVLGLSEADARRLMAEVYERKEAEAAEAKAKAEEEMRALKLQRAVERAAERFGEPPSAEVDVEPERVVLVDLVRREALEVEHQLQEGEVLGAREQVLDAGVRGVAFAARGVEPLGRAAVLLQEALELPLDHAAVLEVARMPLQRVLGALGQRVELGAVCRRKVADRRREVGPAEEVLELFE
jgi:hypothetical protein